MAARKAQYTGGQNVEPRCEVWRNVDRLIVPPPRVALARAEANGVTVQIQAISGVSRNVQENIPLGNLVQLECLSERDELCGGGGVVECGDPDPLGASDCERSRHCGVVQVNWRITVLEVNGCIGNICMLHPSVVQVDYLLQIHGKSGSHESETGCSLPSITGEELLYSGCGPDFVFY